ncbi:MAG TPA: crotonase/enoyl-CoA hydratase family protein [Geminicoccaceae bacterium]|nr:crotonase/enoyl-CoA hydratase family protein [Geminicoccaceae bacterium]
MASPNRRMLHGGAETDVEPWSHSNIAYIAPFPKQRVPAADNVVSFDLHDLEGHGDALSVRFEAEQGSLWCTFNHDERPCFTPKLLDAIRRLQVRLKRGLSTPAMTGRTPLRSVVWTSATPGIWNLGGDLTLFIELIRAGSSDQLRRYAHACVDVVYHNLCKLDLPLLTIALVQGDALGGGFEAVLTNDVIIAERGSKFGLPEILFNMFPGMGAYSLLCRRLDGARAQQLLLSGRLYEAEELETMGLVDLVVEPGEGEMAVREYLIRNQRRHRVLHALSQVRRRCQPVSYDELIDVTDIWVATALALDDADLRRMERLAAAQQRRRARATATAESALALSAAG